MNPKLIALQARREILISAAAAQRLAVAQDIAPLRVPLMMADQGLAVVRAVRKHPEWLAGAVVLFAVWRPRGVGSWLLRGWQGWRAVNYWRGIGTAQTKPAPKP